MSTKTTASRPRFASETYRNGPPKCAFDFRSDTLTEPTIRMLESMQRATLGDAVFDEDDTTAAFEAHFAELFGKEKGLFVTSGTAGNQISLRSHLTQPPHSVLADHRAHVVQHEAGGLAMLSQAQLLPIIPSNGLYLTLEDVQKAAILDEDIHHATTRVISLENTLNGVIMPLSEVRRIAKFARDHDIKLHLDGARIWNAVAAGKGTFLEYGREFDSITACFSKGLGAPVGSIIVGSEKFVKHATWIRKAIGGGMRQTGPLAAAAWAAFDDVYPLLPKTHEVAKEIADYAISLNIRTTLPVETNMVWFDLKGAGLNQKWLAEEAAKRGIVFGFDNRTVVHHLISPEAVQALKDTFKTVLERKKSGEYTGNGGTHDGFTYSK